MKTIYRQGFAFGWANGKTFSPKLMQINDAKLKIYSVAHGYSVGLICIG